MTPLMRIRTTIWPGFCRSFRWTTRSAPNRPNTAPEAPTDSWNQDVVLGDASRSEPTDPPSAETRYTAAKRDLPSTCSR